MAASNYKILIRKLDEFTRKYYQNQLIRGAIYSGALLLLFFILVTALEYYGRFGSGVRTILFYTYCSAALFVLTKWVFIPLTRLYKLGKVISHEQAASIIGKHFSNVQDKLVNVLQLYKGSRSTAAHSDLIEASINQKINELQPVPFGSAIDFSENRKYLKYLSLPLLIGILIAFAAPEVFTDGSRRLIQHTSYFEPAAPFSFKIQNKELKAVKNEDYTLQVKLSGKEIPEKAYIEVEGKRYRLNKEGKLNFSHTFKNIQESTGFMISAGGFYSDRYTLEAIPNPILIDFGVKLNYPSYLNKKNETLNNVGDLTVPEGTKVQWDFKTRDTEALSLILGDSAVYHVDQTGDDEYAFGKSFLQSTPYFITTSNRFLNGRDTLQYGINVIPDQYPSIEVESRADSLASQRIYFRGFIKDDHGFTKLTFNYKWKGDEEKNDSLLRPGGLQTFPIKLNKELTQDQFYHLWNLEKLNIRPGEQIEYFFQVWDNDGINGSKSSRTSMRTFKAPTEEELQQEADKSNEQVKENLQQSIENAQNLQKELGDLNKKLLDKKKLGWEEKKQIKDLLEKQKELQKKVSDIKKENKENISRQNEYQQLDENVLEKQQQLQKLFEQVMTDEMKKKFRELEKLMENLDKKKLQEQIEDMQFKNEDLEKELDRSLELFKQLEFEQKLNKTKEQLDKLAEEQEKLSEKTEEKSEDTEALQQEQEELNKEFEKVKKDLNDLKKKNSELENSHKMPDTEEEQKNAEESMKESSEQLEKNNNKKASGSQKNASEQMKKMSEKLSDLQMQMQSGANMEDLNNLRDILENLIKLSFDQEELMTELKGMENDDPQYVKLAQEQKKIRDDAKVIEDSLYALSKRVMQLESVINREISSINQNMDKAIYFMAERRKNQAASRQQYVMTSINNLALMLDEAVQQMQQQMQQMSSGNCTKPGSGKKPKPSAGSMKKMQQQINQRIEQLKKMMEGGQKKGSKPGKKSGSMSKELAKLAAQQAALRQKMRELNEQLNKDGKGGSKGLEKAAEMMEKTEEDLVNKNITRETLERQKKILTRLLEAENAEREREFDKKRQSQEAKNQNLSNPKTFFEYNKEKKKEVEFLKTVPPSFNTFYKSKVAGYFKNK